MKKKEHDTFVGSVRADMRHIATIANFLDSQGIFVDTRPKIASEAVRIVAYGVPEKLQIKSYKEAMEVLYRLGYTTIDREDKTRYYKSLNDALDKEKEQENSQETIDTEVRKQVAKYNERHSHAASPNMNGVEAILEPEEEPDPEPEPKEKPEPEPDEKDKTKPESKSEPESESKQLKERTPTDEAKDIKKLKSAMAIPDGAPLEDLEEITPRSDNGN